MCLTVLGAHVASQCTLSVHAAAAGGLLYHLAHLSLAGSCLLYSRCWCQVWKQCWSKPVCCLGVHGRAAWQQYKTACTATTRCVYQSVVALSLSSSFSRLLGLILLWCLCAVHVHCVYDALPRALYNVSLFLLPVCLVVRVASCATCKCHRVCGCCRW